MSDKPKVAFYWCASCGGCEEAVVDLAEQLLDVAGAVEIVLADGSDPGKLTTSQLWECIRQVAATRGFPLE